MDSSSNFQRICLLFIVTLTWGISPDLKSQVRVAEGDGIEVIIEKKEKRKINSYFLLQTTLQNPYMVTVPMIPENTHPDNFSDVTTLTALSKGYSFGLGIINKTTSYFEFGFLADYHQNSIPIAISGERSYGPWIYEKTNEQSYYTDPFTENIDRVCEVYTIRATVRLKLPLGPIKLWAGVTGGTYTSTVRYSAREDVSFFNSASKTFIAPAYQAGFDLLIRDKRKKEVVSLIFFTEFASPTLDETIYDMAGTGWTFTSVDENMILSPMRFGIALGIHIQ